MSDTSAEIAARVAAHHAALTPWERLSAAAQLFEAARRIVDSSLPTGLDERERRRQWARRMYGDDLPPAALEAYARAGSHALAPAPQLADWSAMARGAYSRNTLRAWRADWAAFDAYCRAHDLVALPAEPLTVRGYVFDRLARQKRPATVRRYLATIVRAHAAAGAPNPTTAEPVRLAMKEMGRTTTARQRQARGLTWTEIARLLARAPTGPRDLRDRALLAVAYDTLCRREEIVALRIEDLLRTDDGAATILIRRTKTDPTGEGSSAWLAPTTVALVDAWLADAGIVEGALFRRLHTGNSVGGPLSPGAIATLMKRAGRALGLPAAEVARLSGHSTRVGAAQDLLVLSIDIPALMQAGRWKDTRMPLRYGERVLASRLGQLKQGQLSLGTLTERRHSGISWEIGGSAGDVLQLEGEVRRARAVRGRGR